jgi:isocitrate dehydrogenase
MFTELVNHFRCRVESVIDEKTQKEVSRKESEYWDIISKIANDANGKIRVCSIEMLIKIGDKKGYSLAQGQ